jgi:hypothetical protein
MYFLQTCNFTQGDSYFNSLITVNVKLTRIIIINSCCFKILLVGSFVIVKIQIYRLIFTAEKVSFGNTVLVVVYVCCTFIILIVNIMLVSLLSL